MGQGQAEALQHAYGLIQEPGLLLPLHGAGDQQKLFVWFQDDWGGHSGEWTIRVVRKVFERTARLLKRLVTDKLLADIR